MHQQQLRLRQEGDRLPEVSTTLSLHHSMESLEVQISGLTQRLDRVRLSQAQRKLQKDMEQALKKIDDGLTAFGLLMGKLRTAVEAKVSNLEEHSSRGLLEHRLLRSQAIRAQLLCSSRTRKTVNGTWTKARES